MEIFLRFCFSILTCHILQHFFVKFFFVYFSNFVFVFFYSILLNFQYLKNSTIPRKQIFFFTKGKYWQIRAKMPERNFEVWNVAAADVENNSSGSSAIPTATIYYIPYTYGRVWSVERRLWNPELSHRMFTRHWHLSIYIVLLYIAGPFIQNVIENIKNTQKHLYSQVELN